MASHIPRDASDIAEPALHAAAAPAEPAAPPAAEEQPAQPSSCAAEHADGPPGPSTDTSPNAAADVLTNGAAPAADMAACGSVGEESPHDDQAEDVRACLFSLLQRKCPELRITCNALGMLEGLLDQIVQRVLVEAAKSAAPEAGGDGDAEPLTSLAIQKAVKKLLPNDQLRPYLPAHTKQCWRMDKQSLRGIKRRRAAAEAPAGGEAGDAAEAAVAIDLADTVAL